MHIKKVHMLIMVWLKCTKKLKNGNKKWLDQLPNIVFNICKYRKITCPNRLDVPLRKICVFALCTEYIRKETWYIFSSVNLNFDRFELTKSVCFILIWMYNHQSLWGFYWYPSMTFSHGFNDKHWWSCWRLELARETNFEHVRRLHNGTQQNEQNILM